MTTARTLRDAVVGLLYLVLVVALIALSIVVYNRGFDDDVKVTVLVSNIGTSLQKGSDVQVRGILVGEVTGVTTDGSEARIRVSLNRGMVKTVPADVVARLLPKTLFGERYVSLVYPTGNTGTALASGDVIRQDSSAEGVELQQIFDRLLPLLQAVQPDKLATVLGTLSQTLRNRGAELGTTISTISDYLEKFAPTVPTLAGDLDALADVATTYSTAAPDLISALDDLTTTSATVVQQRQQLTDLFATVTTASDTTSGFLGTNQSNIIALATDSLPTLRVLAAYSSEFPCVASALRDFVPVADQALGKGTSQAGLHVTLSIVPSRGKYVAGVDSPTGAVPAGGPSCPYTPPVGAANTAIGALASTPAGTNPTSSLSPTVRSYLASAGTGANGIGPENSPQENQLIAELMAPTIGIAPADYPKWGSLLLGPMLRGTQISLTGAGP